MHKPFYASGFLYHLATQQILLQQSDPSTHPLSTWSMFGGISRGGEDAQTAFQRIVYERVNIRLEAKCLFPVYDYFYTSVHKTHYVLYAEVPKLYTFPLLQTGVFSWFTFKLTAKLAFSDQVKQDVIVSERVIKAEARSKEPSILPHPGQYSSL